MGASDDQSKQRPGTARVVRAEVWNGSDRTFTETPLGFMVGTGGAISLKSRDDAAVATVPGFVPGTYAWELASIEASGTTASDITFLF